MPKQVQASAVDTNTQAPFKATTMYNFRPTRAPKVPRFSSKQRYTTTTTIAPLKPLAYKKHLYRRTEKEESASKTMNLPAMVSKKNVYSEESSREEVRDKNHDTEVTSEEENLSNKEESFSQEVEEEGENESREAEFGPESRHIDQSNELEPETREAIQNSESKLMNARASGVQESLKKKIQATSGQNTPEAEENERTPIRKEGESTEETSREYEAGKKRQLKILREKRNNIRHTAITYDVDTESNKIKRR